MGKTGLLVKPDGETVELSAAQVGNVARILGENHRSFEAESGDVKVLVHEMWKVADLPYNVYASQLTRTVTGGPVVLISAQGGELPSKYTDPLHIARIGSQCRDISLVYKLPQHYEAHRQRKNFVFHPPDRWIYNGRYFSAIVVEGRAAEFEYAPDTRGVWLFKSPGAEAGEATLDGYSLAYAMELLMEGDEMAADGNPPEWLQRFLR